MTLCAFYFCKLIGKLTVFFHLQEFSQRNHIVDSSLATVLRNNLNIDGAPIVSKSHTHPSHSQTSRLLTSSLSSGVPVPRPTQCLWGV